MKFVGELTAEAQSSQRWKMQVTADLILVRYTSDGLSGPSHKSLIFETVPD
ncbi:MAG: hypothetical protein F6K62_15005 [Sphaerospermopsis sp. SIO1G2]|nr:hypothetical protein [Sphaerospermopsis sp. SIO1G1]NET72189.1 hypothetical protein [Sphaerospermopsis sp. SIO1G2]